jgi:hypothetical protein
MMEEWKGGKRCYKLRVAVQTLAKRIEHAARRRRKNFQRKEEGPRIKTEG